MTTNTLAETKSTTDSKPLNRQVTTTKLSLRTKNKKVSKKMRELLDFIDKNPEDPIVQAMIAYRKEQIRNKNRIKDQLNGICRLYSRSGKIKKAPESLGCSAEDFIIYLESKFEVGMDWSNYGNIWSIDHIVHKDLFDFNNEAHVRVCNHFSNLRPLWVLVNRGRRAKWNEELPQHIKEKLEHETGSEHADSTQNLSLPTKAE